RSVSESAANATGASATPRTKNAVAGLNFTESPLVRTARTSSWFRHRTTISRMLFGTAGGVLHNPVRQHLSGSTPANHRRSSSTHRAATGPTAQLWGPV